MVSDFMAVSLHPCLVTPKSEIPKILSFKSGLTNVLGDSIESTETESPLIYQLKNMVLRSSPFLGLVVLEKLTFNGVHPNIGLIEKSTSGLG